MRLHHLLAAGVIGVLLSAATVCADAPNKPAVPPSPLRLIPTEAELLLEVRDPSRIAKLLRHLDLLDQVQTLSIVKEQLDSTNARRARQLLGYFEKSLSGKWPDLLDQIAGGGVALGAKIGDGAPVVFVVQGKDAQRMQEFVRHAATVIEGELSRSDSKDKLTRGKYEGIEGYKIGNGFFMAQVDSALVLANKKEAMLKALHLHLGKDKNSMVSHPGVLAARKELHPRTLASLWINMKPIHDSPQSKELYGSPRDNFILTLSFGSTLDVLGSSPWMAVGIHDEADGFQVSIRAPRGRKSMGADSLLHVPPEKPAARPLLEPANVIYSSTFYYNVGAIWKDRDKLLPKAQADGLTDADKGLSKQLAGFKLGAFLESVGAYHRVVVAHQPKATYKKTPAQKFPAFGIVTETKVKERFLRYMEAALGAGALAATQQFGLNLVEDKHNGTEITAYRFDETVQVKQDAEGLRFNFSPSWTMVGDQFILCSTQELCRELVDLIQAENKAQPKRGQTMDRYYSTGAANLLQDVEDTLLAQAILDQALPPGEAREQVQAVLKMVRGLGSLSSQAAFDAERYRYDIRFRRR